MLEQIAYGVITGVGYSIAGWKKYPEFAGTKYFDWKKLAFSVVTCAVVGGVAGYTGNDFNILMTGAVGIGVTKVIKLGWGFLYRFMKGE